jgi:hypothetical protein
MSMIVWYPYHLFESSDICHIQSGNRTSSIRKVALRRVERLRSRSIRRRRDGSGFQHALNALVDGLS